MPRKKISPDQQAQTPPRLPVTPDDATDSAVHASADAQPVVSDVVESPPSADFPIVGIGASAGGLAAFEAFFKAMPAETDRGIAFVLVQHLAPDHASLLRELIQRYTQMPVYDIEDGMVIEHSSVYIIPPNKDLAIFHGRLQLMSAPRGLHLPIDRFFRSLAQEQEDAAIAIVLSGAGSDGTLGMRAVKEVGGMVMAQTPASAEYDSMPQSAIATSLVDYVLPPEEMPAQLLAYVQRTVSHVTPEIVVPYETASHALQQIFQLLRTQIQHDFTDYKQNTILRRIERRMVIHQWDSMDAYARYLQETPQEVNILFRELLIGVTRFFRDSDTFAELKTQVIPRLFDGKSEGESVRVWVPGCSTGEEAYSIAMLLREYSATRSGDIKVQVFATDIDAVAIDTARAGVYPDNIVADVPPEYLTRYFVHAEGTYRVHKSIRDIVVFAEQDIILDPPFSHMDMISCRNLLIYLNADLQKRLLPLFHYALNPNGFLFLGSSETIGEFTELFTTVDRKHKFYQRRAAVNPSRLIPGLRPPHVSAAVGQGASSREMKSTEPISMRTLVEQNLLAHHTPPCVLINDAEQVLYVHGSTGSYLEPATGDANLNLLRMARPGLRLELATAIHKAITQRAPTRYDGVQVQVKEQLQTMNLLVRPVTSPPAPGLYLVVFEDVATVARPPADTSTSTALTDTDQRIAILERELQLKDEYLQTNLGELTTSNEELQSTNEELQSINEEMDTSREELQSVNEELSTVNAELQKKIEELSLSNDDMNNLLAGTDVGTVFIDRDLRIQRFTPAATAIVNLIPTDIGRPIAHLATNLVHYETLLQDARRVFETLEPKEVEVQSTDGRWYLMRILPYRTQKNAIVGVVITFVNTTTLRTMQERLQAAQLAEQTHAFAESIVATVREPILVLDADLRVVSVNDAFTKTFKVPKGDTVGTLVYDLGNGQWDIPDLRTLLEEVLPERTTIHDYLVTHTFEHIGPRMMRLNARELRLANGQPRMILLAIEDETEPVGGGS